MLLTEREKLFSYEEKFISIGITRSGNPLGAISVPWESTANAFGMRLPNVYITPDDLADEEIMQAIRSKEVVGCYVFTALTDYSFLSTFTELTDLNIYNGKAIKKLDFLLPLKKCRYFFLGDAQLENLDEIIELQKENKGLFRPLSCVGLYLCSVRDISRFESERHCFSEFIVWARAGTNERKRWRTVCANTYRYYEVED